ncbi:MAG TPA: hypothetical protein VFS07_00225 [Gemmatimonadales bacterium]|nr:hypothetical protein [Gemmatimonadales bacterium]
MRTIALLALAGAVVLPRAASAQRQRDARWALKGLQAGGCVDFLTPTTHAKKLLDRGFAPASLADRRERFPRLFQVASGEGDSLSWTPGTYCWFAYDSAVVRGHKVDVDHGRQPVLVGYVALAADGPGAGGDTLVAVSIFTNAGRLQSAANDARLLVERVKFTRGPNPEREDPGEDLLYTVNHGKTTFQFEGHPGAPTDGRALGRSLVARSFTGSLFYAQAPVGADSSFVPSGNARVLGEGDLQAAMAASPMRFMWTFVVGGDTEWVLSQ